MISNQNLVLHACIAKGSTIVAEFCRDSGLAETARKCIEKTPPNHSMFSHTAKKRTYTFLIEDPFAYFAIFDEDLDRAEGLWFLNRIKGGFEEKLKSGSIRDSENLEPRCFQSNMDLIFQEILRLDLGLEDDSLATGRSESRNPSLDSSSEERRSSPIVLLMEKPNEGLKKKKKSGSEMMNGSSKDHADMEMIDDNVVGLKDFPVLVHKAAPILFPGTDRQKAKQVWKKHVWVVLILDLFVCSILFGIWLWVCRGLQCIDG